MKRFLSAFLAATALTSLAPGAARAQTPSFKNIVPGLQLLESGFPAVTDIDPNSYNKYEADVATGTYKFTGTVITTDIIRDKLGLIRPPNTSMVTKQLAVIKKLVIYCDSLSLTDTIWLPQADIVISARVINMNGRSINTSPLKWAAENINAVSADKTTGVDGLNAGSINIVSDRIIHPGKLIAKGTGGEWVYAPEVTVTYPTGKTNIEIHRNMGCSTQGSQSRNTDISSRNGGVIAGVFENDDECWFSSTYCTGYVSWDDGIYFSKEDGKASTLGDRKEYSRINAPKVKPGKGGDGGSIVVDLSSGHFPAADIDNSAGATGYYVARPGSTGASYTAATTDQHCSGITIPSKNYLAVRYHVGISTANLVFPRKEDWESAKIEVPSKAATDKFVKDLALDTPNTAGIKGSVNINQRAFHHHPEYYLVRSRYIREQYSIYHKKSPADQAILDAETNNMVLALQQILEDRGLPKKDRTDYLTAYNSVLELSMASAKNLDEYFNVPGYRPLLSITSTMSYIDKNLHDDLRLFVLADQMATSEENAGKFKEKIPGMITDLAKTNTALADRLTEINEQYRVLAGKARECRLKTDSIKDRLKELEKQLRKTAESDVKRMAIIKAGVKTCALAASVIPYGQPALGQIVGNGLNALADNLGDPDNNIAASMMEKMDMSDVMDRMAEYKLSELKPKDDKKEKVTLNFLDPEAMSKSLAEVIAHNNGVAKEKADKEKQQYEDTLKKTKEMYTKTATGVKDIMTGYMKNSANKDDIEKSLAALMNQSYMFQDVQRQLTEQINQKEEIFRDLNALLQESISVKVKIMQNADNLYLLQQKYADPAQHNKGMEEVMRDIRNASLARLKWVEYQLVKVYEYTTLQKYNNKMPCSEVLMDKYNGEKQKVTMANLETLVTKLEVAYKGQQTEMGNNILKNVSASHKQDAKSDPENKGKYGRKILLAADPAASKGRYINTLNDTHSVIINLQKDLTEEIIKPDEAETRIIDISLDEVEFEKPLPANTFADITFDIQDGGVLRKDDKFYFFQVGSEDHAPDRWKWAIRNVKGKNVITNKSELSKQYTELIKFMTGQDQKTTSPENNENLFTLPPAWSDCRIALRTNVADPATQCRIKKLMFSVRCDYTDKVNNHKKILDIKLDNAPEGALYKITTDAGNTAREQYSNYYGIEPVNANVTVEVNEPTDSTDDTRRFLYWEVYGSTPKEKLLTGKKVTFKHTGDTRVVAVFGEKKRTVKRATAAPAIVLYEKAATTSPIIASVPTMDKVTVLDEKPENGFKRIIYNGVQEAFMAVD